MIERPEKEAAEGQVTAVQAAVRSGWRLVEIKLRDGPEGEGPHLAFILRRKEDPSRAVVG